MSFENLSISDSIKLFHKERMNSLVKESKCEGCEDDMRFKASDHALILSCGSTRGKCGDQVRISLPTYLNYDRERIRLKSEDQYHDDIYDLSRYDLSKVLRTFEFSDDFKERVEQGSEIRERSKEERIDLIKSFHSENKTAEKEELLREVARHRHKIANERLKLEQSIMVEDDSMKRENYRRDLAKLCLRERKQVIDPLRKLKEPMIRIWPSDYATGVFPGEESSVDELQTTYRAHVKKKQKKKKVQKQRKKKREES